MGTMDHWDPAVTDGFAGEREVILFNNAGISSSSGDVPTSIEGMGANAIAFIKVLGLKQVDLLGFSIGGTVAQAITLAEPHLVRRLVLVGTGPRSGDGMDTVRRKRSRFSAPPMKSRTIFGCVLFTPPKPARPPAAVPQALPPAPRESRSGSEREGRAGADRGDRQMGRQTRSRGTT